MKDSRPACRVLPATLPPTLKSAYPASAKSSLPLKGIARLSASPPNPAPVSKLFVSELRYPGGCGMEWMCQKGGNEQLAAKSLSP